MASSLTIVTEVWVPGRPKTKGSLDFRRGGGVTENVAGSKEWRAMVARAVQHERSRRGARTPSVAPVGVRALFVLPFSAGSEADEDCVPAPIAARTGDTDKLARNILDALTDAGAYKDDVQVCKLVCNKVYADNEHLYNGALVQCWELLPWELQAMRRVVMLGTAGLVAA